MTQARAENTSRQPRFTVRAARPAGLAASLRASRQLAVEHLAQAWAWPTARQGFLAMLLIAMGSLSNAFLPVDAPILEQPGLTWLGSGPAQILATTLVLVGLAALLDAWLRMRPAPGRPTAPAATWVLWSLPVLLAPPLFSRDAYSYAAQGLVVSRGMNPYEAGPIAVPGPFADQVDALWLYTPAPYGPVALQVQRLIVDLTGGHAFVAAIAMRLPALLAVGAIAWALPRLAQRMGVSADQARWLGVANPLVLMHLVGGAHNDAMMIALVVVALLLASEGRLVAACAAIAAGAGFKQTAVLALVGVAGLAYRHARGQAGESPRTDPVDQGAYVRVAIRCGLVAFAFFAALTALTGLGWGWLDNLSVPGSVISFLSPVTMTGVGLEWLLAALGLPAWSGFAGPTVGALGALAALGVLAWTTWSLAPRRPVAAAAVALFAFTFGGPTVYPWYVLWGIVLLGATVTDRRVVQAVVWATGWLIAYAAVDVAFVNGIWILWVAIIATAGWRVWRQRLDRVDAPLCRPSPPVLGRAGDAARASTG